MSSKYEFFLSTHTLAQFVPIPHAPRKLYRATLRKATQLRTRKMC